MGLLDTATSAIGKVAGGAVSAVTGAVFKGMPKNTGPGIGTCPAIANAPLYGFVRYNGREYQYTYIEPTTEEVNKLKQSLMQENPQLTERDCRHWAHSALRHKQMVETETKVFELLRRMNDEMFKNQRLSEQESGISQRRNTEIFLDDFAGDYGLALKPVNWRYLDTYNADNKVISDDDALNFPNNLAAELNAALYEKKQKREKDIKTTVSIKGDKKTIDLMIPVPDTGSYQDKFHAMASYMGGFGQVDAQRAQELSRLNRFAKSLIPGTRELVGFTFITRPHLNLSNANIAAVRSFAPLLYSSDHSDSKMIKLLLDTEMQVVEKELNCEQFDPCNPFLVPLCNSLLSISGFPDPTLATETTEGGFFSESQTCVIGYDRLAKGYDLQLQFKDLPGGPILAMHDYWYQYMGYLGDGSLSQYNYDIEHNLMGYTSSIYRFVMDATCRQIVRWSKATGCFPRMAPVGAPFNYGQGEHVVMASREFSVPWFAHHIGYNDPIILKEFNMLVRRYANWLDITDGNESHVDVVNSLRIRGDIMNNRSGIPYITQENGFNELVWLYNPDDKRKAVVEKPDVPDPTDLEKYGQQRIDENVNSQFGG